MNTALLIGGIILAIAFGLGWLLIEARSVAMGMLLDEDDQ